MRSPETVTHENKSIYIQLAPFNRPDDYEHQTLRGKKEREHTHINNERHVEKCVMNGMKEKEKNRETLKSLIVSSSLARILSFWYRDGVSERELSPGGEELSYRHVDCFASYNYTSSFFVG